VYYDINGDPVQYESRSGPGHFVRLRYLEDSATNGFSRKSLPRYVQAAGSGVHAYFPMTRNFHWADIAAAAETPLIITEGEKKALKGCLERFPTIGLGGVWCFKRDGQLLPELQRFAWKGRPVSVVFDSDAASNPHIGHAQRSLAKLLVERGAEVSIVSLPDTDDGTKQGLDDFLVRQGADALEALLEQASPVDPFLSRIITGSDVEVANALHLKLCERYSSEIIFTEGRFYAFTGKAWDTIENVSIRKAIHEFDGAAFGQNGKLKLSAPKIESILSILKDQLHKEAYFHTIPTGVNCENGFVTIDESGEASISAHQPEQRQRFWLKASWAPGPVQESGLLKTLLDGCFAAEEDKKHFLQECLGLAIMGQMTEQVTPQAIVLHGVTAANGKSEVLELFRALFPQNAVSCIPPGDLGDDCKLVQLNGKALNLCSELGTGRSITSDVFKAVITGDTVTGRELYAPALSFKPKAMHLFATNTLPGFSGGMDEGVIRRLAILEFNRTIPEEERIPKIGRRVASEEGSNLLAWAMEGASRVIKRGRLMTLESSRAAVREWAHTSDIVQAWLAERCSFVEGPPISTRHLHEDFQLWASLNGYDERTTPKAPAFGKRVIAAAQGKVVAVRADGQRALQGLRLKPLTQPTRRRVA
jgi:P4 family phage/plasmid primase-like protien